MKHLEILDNLAQGKGHAKIGNHVPHMDTVKAFMSEIAHKKARNEKTQKMEQQSHNFKIMRENQILLGKLVEIVGRKNSVLLPEVSPKTERRTKTAASCTSRDFSSTFAQRDEKGRLINFSLNGTWKKKEAERITYENKFIADRLFN